MCTERYINLFTDFGFKRAFGNAANKDYLLSLLNTLIDDSDPITDITYRNVEHKGFIATDRGAVYDLYCTTQSGAHAIVEMQNAKQKYFIDRSIYYSTYPIWEGAEKGEWDFNLPKVYTIALLNFTMPVYDGNPNFRHAVKLTDVDTKKVVFDKLTYIYIELPKFNAAQEDINDQDMLSAWLFIIKNMHRLDKMPPQLQNEIFHRFFEMAEIAAFNKEDRLAYEQSLKNLRDYDNTIETAKEDGIVIGREEGISIGREEGISIGREEGISIGREEGMAIGAQLKLIEVAKTMLLQGMSVEMISKVTGLSDEKVKDIGQ